VLGARLLSAIVLVPVVLFVVYRGGLFWLAGILLVAALAWRELAVLVKHSRFNLATILGLLFVFGAIIDAYADASGLLKIDLIRPLIAGLIIVSLIWALYDRSEQPTADWAITVASAIYLGLMLGHFISLRMREDGFQWVVVALGLTWIVDTFAYFVGSTLGRHKLWPRISPRKTWEGLAGGTLAGLIAGPLVCSWLLGLNPWLGLLVGALVALFDPFGDFAVSMFKRIAGIKDSSRLIPGHGGMLDRLDSLLFIFPILTYFAAIVRGP
jgi:phosphatidate cytidylyltransferase